MLGFARYGAAAVEQAFSDQLAIAWRARMACMQGARVGKRASNNAAVGAGRAVQRCPVIGPAHSCIANAVTCPALLQRQAA